MSTPSQRPALAPRQLTRTDERLSFVYLERCTVHRDANAITAQDAEGTTHIPSATIGTLLLGPGTRVTHQAMSVLGETGAAVCWVGEHGVKRDLRRAGSSERATIRLEEGRQTPTLWERLMHINELLSHLSKSEKVLGNCPQRP
ncbi:hypothetical protein GCM10018783_00400 [Streptomyces griseosporeus]|nr:hypothetical protein GCM10018783_00400 [Streptomyces griseosporeus]